MAGQIPRHEFGAGSTPTPSRRNEDGVGSETDGQWEDDFETASAGGRSDSSQDDIDRNTARIRAKYYKKQQARHQKEHEDKLKARSIPQLPPVTEEDVAQAAPGATAAPRVAETQRPASPPEILRVEDPKLPGIPHDPERAKESRRRFLQDTEAFGTGTPTGMLRSKAVPRWPHSAREGETNLIKQLNPMFGQKLLESAEFQAFHGTANGDPMILLAGLSDWRHAGRSWQPWERLLSAGKMLVTCLGGSWADMDTDLAEERFGPHWPMSCGLCSTITTLVMQQTLNPSYDWKTLAGGKHVQALILDLTGTRTKPYWEELLRALCRFSLLHDGIKGGVSVWTEDLMSEAINNKAIFCNCCAEGDLLDYDHLTSKGPWTVQKFDPPRGAWPGSSWPESSFASQQSA